jgi:hypothetical protein
MLQGQSFFCYIGNANSFAVCAAERGFPKSTIQQPTISIKPGKFASGVANIQGQVHNRVNGNAASKLRLCVFVAPIFCEPGFLPVLLRNIAVVEPQCFSYCHCPCRHAVALLLAR